MNTHIFFFVVHQLFLLDYVFANGPGDKGSIPYRVIPKTQKWYLISPCLTFSIIRYRSRIKWSNQKKGVAPSSTPQCCSYWKGSLWFALEYGCQLYQSRRETIIQSQVESYQTFTNDTWFNPKSSHTKDCTNHTWFNPKSSHTKGSQMILDSIQVESYQRFTNDTWFNPKSSHTKDSQIILDSIPSWVIPKIHKSYLIQSQVESYKDSQMILDVTLPNT